MKGQGGPPSLPGLSRFLERHCRPSPRHKGAVGQAVIVAPNRLRGSPFQLPPAVRRLVLSWEPVSKTPRDFVLMVLEAEEELRPPRSAAPQGPALHGYLLLLSLSRRMQGCNAGDCHLPRLPPSSTLWHLGLFTAIPWTGGILIRGGFGLGVGLFVGFFFFK